jgi:hypothetical protein
MVNSKQSTLSQAAIGRALGLSSASVTKCKKMGMPVHDVEAARTWRENNIAPTAHQYLKRNPSNKRQPKARQPSGTLPQALALLNIAAAALEAGQSITAMVPTLRAALHAVPEHERDPEMLLQVEVMDVLTADVFAVLNEQDNEANSASTDGPMPDDEADEMGRFWYQVAAGEIRPA